MKRVVYTEQDRRIEVESPLMRESLIDEPVRRQTISSRERGVMPNLNVIYEDDPKKNPSAKLIRKISARELLDAKLPDLVIEPVVLENMLLADHVREIQTINGMKRGLLTRALEGEHVGTIIHA